jgi:hypothetical protein
MLAGGSGQWCRDQGRKPEAYACPYRRLVAAAGQLRLIGKLIIVRRCVRRPGAGGLECGQPKSKLQVRSQSPVLAVLVAMPENQLAGH